MTPRQALRVATSQPITPEIAEHLAAMTGDPDARVRVIAVVAVMRLSQGRAVTPETFALLFEGDDADDR